MLTGAKIGGKSRTMSRQGEGSLDALARPDDVGLFLAALCGSESSSLVEGSTGAYKHIFTMTTDEVLKSLFFKVKRDTSIFKLYNGITFDSLSLNTQSEDFLNLSFNVKGKDEADTTMESGLSSSPLSPFRLENAVVDVEGTSLEVLSTKFEMKNNLSAVQTNKSGIYMSQPKPGARDITVEYEVFYDADSNTIRNSYWLEDTVFSTKLKWLNGANVETGFPYSLEIELPTCQLTDASPNISGKEDVKFTLPLKAVYDGVSPITITLINGFATNYLV